MSFLEDSWMRCEILEHGTQHYAIFSDGASKIKNYEQ